MDGNDETHGPIVFSREVCIVLNIWMKGYVKAKENLDYYGYTRKVYSHNQSKQLRQQNTIFSCKSHKESQWGIFGLI